MKRAFDLLAALVLILTLLLPIFALAILIKLISKSDVLYWSERVGKDGQIFTMPKFRTMRVGTPNVATHLLEKPDQYLTSVGGFLRRTSLDELPQLFSVLKGDMSFVGPRPALFNQDDLLALRKQKGVDKLLPGITGWAQVNGRDKLSVADKVVLEVEYLQKQSFWFDVKILWMTLIKVIKKDGILH